MESRELLAAKVFLTPNHNRWTFWSRDECKNALDVGQDHGMIKYLGKPKGARVFQWECQI